MNIIPTTFVGAFTQPNVLQVLLVSVLFAFALTLVGERGRPVFDLIGALTPIFYRIVGFIMWVAPLGAFGSIAFTVGKFGTSSLISLGELIIEFYVVSLLFVFLVLGGVAWWAGVSLFRLLRYIREEIVIVAATTSTETVLPRLMLRLRELGCEESVVGLVIPTGYSFNLDGTCLYLATVVVFLAQATNTPLDLTHQLIVLAVLLLASKGAAGVAGAAFVVLAATLGALGTVPVASIALVLGIHRLMAEALTFVNLVGNSVATIVVSRWEGALDFQALNERVGLRSNAPPANFRRELQGGWRPARTVASHRQYSIRDKLLYNARLRGSGNGNALESGSPGTVHGGFKATLRNPGNDCGARSAGLVRQLVFLKLFIQ